MASIRRFAFLVDLPDVEERKEYATAGEDLTAEEAVERLYKVMPDGASIVKPLRGEIPDDLDLSRSEAEFVTEKADESEADEEPDEEVPGEWVDWNEEDWLDLDYQKRQLDVEHGLVDDHLDAIEDCETSRTVEEAVADRREILEGEA